MTERVSRRAVGTVCADRKEELLTNQNQKNIGDMKLKPLADRVLIQPTAAEEVTASGIIIPDSAKEKPLKGKVVAAGPGTKDEAMELKEGDTVYFGKYAGTELEFSGEKYLIMRQSDVLAVEE